MFAKRDFGQADFDLQRLKYSVFVYIYDEKGILSTEVVDKISGINCEFIRNPSCTFG